MTRSKIWAKARAINHSDIVCTVGITAEPPGQVVHYCWHMKLFFGPSEVLCEPTVDVKIIRLCWCLWYDMIYVSSYLQSWLYNDICLILRHCNSTSVPTSSSFPCISLMYFIIQQSQSFEGVCIHFVSRTVCSPYPTLNLQRLSFSSRHCTDLEQSSAAYHICSVTSRLLLSPEDILYFFELCYGLTRNYCCRAHNVTLLLMDTLIPLTYLLTLPSIRLIGWG